MEKGVAIKGGDKSFLHYSKKTFLKDGCITVARKEL